MKANVTFTLLVAVLALAPAVPGVRIFAAPNPQVKSGVDRLYVHRLRRRQQSRRITLDARRQRWNSRRLSRTLLPHPSRPGMVPVGHGH